MILVYLLKVVMPEMNGQDLAGQITDLYPHIRILFMSGYTANIIAHQGILDDGPAFIQKPFSMAEMNDRKGAGGSGCDIGLNLNSDCPILFG